MGLMQAIELAYENKEPATPETLKIMEKTKEKGLLIRKAGLWGNALRIAPPLNISKGDVDTCIEILDMSFAEVLK